MSEFSLIKQLDTPPAPHEPPQPKIDYSQYKLVVEGRDQMVNIPKREAANFENAVAQLPKHINRDKLRDLLRTFRGTRA